MSTGATFGGKAQFTSDPCLRYVVQHSLRLHPAQQKLIDLTQPLAHSGMLSSPDEIQLLQNLVRSIGATKTLDIGVFTGYSAMSIAMSLPKDGKVVACDVSDEWPNIGKPAWQEAGVTDKIELIIGPATETLKQLLDDGEEGTFDFAFIDADKLNYDNYYEACLRLLRPNGIIALDNMMWSGKVVDPSVNDPNTVAIRKLTEKIHADDRVNVSFLTVGDGTVLVFKK